MNKELKFKLAKNTLAFVCIYLLTSLIFACIYFTQERSFFHANPKNDPAYYDLKQEVLKAICHSFQGKFVQDKTQDLCISNIQKSKSFSIYSFEGLDVAELKSFSIRVGDVTANRLRVFIHSHIQQSKNLLKKLGSTGGSGDIYEINLDESNLYGKETILQLVDSDSIFKMVTPISQNRYNSYLEFYLNEGIVELLGFKTYSNVNGNFLAIPSPQESIFQLKEYLTSVPNKEPSFLKLLYFSALTLASFGFGDIIPIGYVSRVVVTIQVIVGILLFGFFISLLFDNYKDSREKKSLEDINREKLKSIFKLWGRHRDQFEYSKKMVLDPIDSTTENNRELHFNQLENLFFKFGLNTLKPLNRPSYKGYFESLRSIRDFCKIVITNFEYNLNSSLIDLMVELVNEIDQNDYESTLDERMVLMIGNRKSFEHDIEMIKNENNPNPDFRPSHSINVYVAIWKSMKSISDKIERMDSFCR